MKLPVISMLNKTPYHFYKNNKGFTLFEVIIVIAIISMLFAIGSFVDLSMLNRSSITSEQATLVSVLQKARNRAMNNIDAKPHGVRINTNEYILFRGTSYNSGDSTNEKISKNSKNTITGVNDIVFEQLSGNPIAGQPTKTGDIILTDGNITKKITIVEGGLIDW